MKILFLQFPISCNRFWYFILIDLWLVWSRLNFFSWAWIVLVSHFDFTGLSWTWNSSSSTLFWTQSSQHRQAEVVHWGRGNLHWEVSKYQCPCFDFSLTNNKACSCLHNKGAHSTCLYGKVTMMQRESLETHVCWWGSGTETKWTYGTLWPY